jgi:hypothetical protein
MAAEFDQGFETKKGERASLTLPGAVIFSNVFSLSWAQLPTAAVSATRVTAASTAVSTLAVVTTIPVISTPPAPAPTRRRKSRLMSRPLESKAATPLPPIARLSSPIRRGRSQPTDRDCSVCDLRASCGPTVLANRRCCGSCGRRCERRRAASHRDSWCGWCCLGAMARRPRISPLCRLHVATRVDRRALGKLCPERDSDMVIEESINP